MMNTIRNLSKLCSCFMLVLAAASAARAQDIPAAINYQGKLTDNLGNELASGYYEIEFRIWDDATSASAASLVWGRTFPLHVVEGGLFNILLSNDGGEVTSSGAPQFNDIRQAFAGEDRYLGLTITVDPSGTITSPSEISPRQQLASAPYAMQAQTANSVRNLGVTSAALVNNSITSEKMNANAVTTAKIADNAVTTAKIADGAVTSSKLNVNNDVHLNDHPIYLRSGSDTNHGLKHAGSFAGENHDGPVLFGFSNGVLGTTQGGEKVALSWDSVGRVSLFGGVHNITTFLPTNTSGTHGKGIGETVLAIKADGLLMYYSYQSHTDISIADSTGTSLTDEGILPIEAKGDGGGKLFTWPVRAGDVVTLNCTAIYDGSRRNQLWMAPFGVAPMGRDDYIIKTN